MNQFNMKSAQFKTQGASIPSETAASLLVMRGRTPLAVRFAL